MEWPAGVNRSLGVVLGVLLSAMGALFVLIDEPGGDTWVRVGDKKVDADVVGVPLLVAGLLIVVASLVLGRQRTSPPE